MNSAFARETIPAWYELSLKGDSIICVKVHRAALAEIQKKSWDTAPAIEHMSKLFGFTFFTKPIEGDCGFENVFKQGASDRPDWIVWEIQLPVIWNETQKGRLTKGKDSHEEVIAIRATLWFFLSTAFWLYGSEKGNTGWKESQLIIIEGIGLPDDNRMGSGGLSVTLMPAVIPWLAKHEDHEHIQPLVDAMKKAYNHMWPKLSRFERFQALFRKPKRLDLQVPGDRCDLSPEWSNSDGDLKEGYTLHPHNVDSSLQQLTFIAGLAKLHDLVRAG